MPARRWRSPGPAHGHVALVHAAARQLGLPGLLGPPCRERDLAYALVISRVVAPGRQFLARRSCLARRIRCPRGCRIDRRLDRLAGRTMAVAAPDRAGKPSTAAPAATVTATTRA